MNIIIGAGWYGLYLASLFQAQNIDYVVFEKEEDILLGSSGFNQNRLHLGFHYPRSFRTRCNARLGFRRFKQQFPTLSVAVDNNIYAIHKDSIMDFETYKAVFTHEKYEFDVLPTLSEAFEGNIRTYEEQVIPDRVKKYFRGKKLNIEFEAECILESDNLYVNGIEKNFTALYDCTWGRLQPQRGYYNELFTTVLVELQSEIDFGALTIMDGPFYSIYPLEQNNNLYTLSSVKHGITAGSAQKSAELTWLQFQSDFPEFAASFSPKTYFTSHKLKPYDNSARRTMEIISRDKIFHILSGKIDTVFELESLTIGGVQ